MGSGRIVTLLALGLLLFGLVLVLYGVLGLRSDPLANPANFLAADKGFGVTIDLTQYDDTELAALLADLRVSGLTWLRQPINWAQIEPKSGQYSWKDVDRVLATIARSNQAHSDQPFKVIAVLQTTPAWARAENQSVTGPPARLRDMGDFARVFADRYADQVDFYQIWHEPNLGAGWGNAFVDPDGYAALLREAAINIRDLDPTAYILLAALAPTLEQTPLNQSELQYLNQLYLANAAPWFDIVAVQPYGFEYDPEDPSRVDRLNFRRVELLRQVMLAHGDGDSPVWATAVGWNTLPENWVGLKAPWSTAAAATQGRRTSDAIMVARRHWPWLGPMLAIRWDTTSLAADDPARGFALANAPPVLQAWQSWATAGDVATPGYYPPSHTSGSYSTGWRLALNRADIPQQAPRRLTIEFEGTQLDLSLSRGNYRGYLWVTVDGQPANGLPRNSAGQSYVVLYDPTRQPAVVTAARDLSWGRHTAVLEAEGGWEQWSIAGWTIFNRPDLSASRATMLLGIVLAVAGSGWLWWLGRRYGSRFWLQPRHWWQRLLAWYGQFSEPVHLGVTFAMAIELYLTSAWVVLVPPLALSILLRPDVGLAVAAFGLSFIPIHSSTPVLGLSALEILLLSVIVGVVINPTRPNWRLINLSAIDGAMLGLLLLGLLSTLFAQNFGVSMHEWRTVMLVSALFYLLTRMRLEYGASSAPDRWLWRLVDAFIAGAVFQALLTIYLTHFGDQYVLVEGVRRAIGVAYTSPNHLALFLGRVWPVALAVALWSGATKRRRIGYALGWGVIIIALFTTYSRGAWLLGLPTSVVVMGGLYLLRQRSPWPALPLFLGGMIGLVIIGLVIFQRLRTPFEITAGSAGFFRLKLWQSSLAMLREHWLLGVGLDNFLYQYRTRYTLPEAWQEPDLSHPHNIILDFATRLGVAGVAVLLWLQVVFWRSAWQQYRRNGAPLLLGLMGSMAAILAHGLVDHAFFLVDLAMAFALIVGLVAGLSSEEITALRRPAEPTQM